MDFKDKFKNFLDDSKSKLLSPSSESTAQSIDVILPTQVYNRKSEITDSDLEISQSESDPHADQEILDHIYAEYFSESFDPSNYELTKLGERFDQLSVDKDRKFLLQQLTVVSKKVFKLILERQNNCAVQLEHIISVQADLLDSLSTCKRGRASLGKAKQQFVNSSLGILAGCRRRGQAESLLENLHIMRTLQRTGERLDHLLNQEKFAEAIKLLIECQNVAVNYKHFTSIRQLSTKLQDTLVMTEEQLDVALSKICMAFDTNAYAEIQEAYKLLGKTQIAMDQLLMHVTTAIHNKSWNLVHMHAAMASSSNPEDLSKRPYPELCQTVTIHHFLPCLVDLAKALWDIMLNYKKVLEWHKSNANPVECSSGQSESEKLEIQLQIQYINKKLESGLIRIWQDVQTKVRVLVQASNLSEFSIDLFICFLDVINRLILVGKEFSGSDSETLQESLQKQCLSYFQAYHTSRLDELKTHLENESWALCPVKLNFDLRSLAEFSHLRVSKSPSKLNNTGESLFFRQHWESNTPFDNVLKSITYEEDILTDATAESFSDSDDDLSEEQKLEIQQENEGFASMLDSLKQRKSTPTTQKQGLCIANTTLNLLRLFGRYSHLMRLLHPIADQILLGMKQLLDYYFYSVFIFFSSDTPRSESVYLSENLLGYLDEVRKEILYETFTITETDKLGNQLRRESSRGIVLAPTKPFTLDLSHKDTQFGLQERIIAVESCIYLAGQINEVIPHVQSSLNYPDILDSFFSLPVAMSSEIRSPVYNPCLLKLLGLEQIIPVMAKVSWELREVRSQHSDYVDILLNQFQNLHRRLEKTGGLVPMSLDLKRELWMLALNSASRMFVEGFSCAKRCTNEGRALMQLDYRQFVLKMEKICDIKPLPFQDLVSAYIKAFYIPESELEQWVKSHPEYTASQLVALVNSVAYSNSKTRQKLNNLVSDLSVRIRR